MHALCDNGGNVRLWINTDKTRVFDLRGHLLAIVDDGGVYDLNRRHVAIWKEGQIFDHEGRILLRESASNPVKPPRPTKFNEEEEESLKSKPRARIKSGNPTALLDRLRFASFRYP